MLDRGRNSTSRLADNLYLVIAINYQVFIRLKLGLALRGLVCCCFCILPLLELGLPIAADAAHMDAKASDVINEFLIWDPAEGLGFRAIQFVYGYTRKGGAEVLRRAQGVSLLAFALALQAWCV